VVIVDVNFAEVVGGECIPIEADITVEHDTLGMVEKIVDRYRGDRHKAKGSE
jgi:hypothetical protein